MSNIYLRAAAALALNKKPRAASKLSLSLCSSYSRGSKVDPIFRTFHCCPTSVADNRVVHKLAVSYLPTRSSCCCSIQTMDRAKSWHCNHVEDVGEKGFSARREGHSALIRVTWSALFKPDGSVSIPPSSPSVHLLFVLIQDGYT